MKLLFWLPQFHPYIGGVEVLESHFLPALVERGHEPSVLTSHGTLDLPDDDEWQGIAVHRRPFAAALAGGRAEDVVALVADVAGLKRQLAPDLIHVNVTDASPFFHLRTRTAHVCPSIVFPRVTVGGGGPTSLLADLLRSADAVTSVSAAALAAAVEVCPEVADRFRVILNALPDPDVDVDPPKAPVLVGAGRLVADKGFDVAIRALAAVQGRAHRPPCSTSPATARPAPSWRRWLASSGSPTGWSCWGGSSLTACPTSSPGRASSSCPPAGSKPSGWLRSRRPRWAALWLRRTSAACPRWWRTGITGTLVPVEDADALARAVLDLLADPAEAARRGAAGREAARTTFAFERYVDEHLALYDELLAA